jgi:hypothetical protein
MRALDLTRKQSIFESIGRGDTYFSTWEREIHPTLCEMALNPTQIDQIFSTVQQNAGRSMLGRATDAVGAAKDKISDAWFNKFGGMLQNSAPVQGFDDKWESIKSSVATKHPEIAAKLAKYGEYAKNNPKMHKFLLAIAGSIAASLGVALAGGVGASALAVGTGAGIATGIINIADRLLQGQKASTAIGRGATAGAVAGLTAGGLSKAKEALSALGATKFLDSGVGMINNNGTTFYLKPEDMAAYHEGQKVANALLRNASINDLGAAMDASAAADAANWAKTLAKIGSEAYQQEAIRDMGTITEIPPGAVGDAANAVASLLNSIGPALSSIAGQAAGGSKPSAQKVTEGQLNELFGMTGNKVDASKLKAAWEKAGSPTDSVALGKFLTTQGISSPAVTSAFAQLKLPDPFAAAPVAKPTATTTSQPTAPATTAQPTAATASQPTAQPTTPAPTSAIGQGIAQYKPGQQGVNPELQKRLAARKAGKPQYAANLEENRLRKHKHVIR